MAVENYDPGRFDYQPRTVRINGCGASFGVDPEWQADAGQTDADGDFVQTFTSTERLYRTPGRSRLDSPADRVHTNPQLFVNLRCGGLNGGEAFFPGILVQSFIDRSGRIIAAPQAISLPGLPGATFAMAQNRDGSRTGFVAWAGNGSYVSLSMRMGNSALRGGRVIRADTIQDFEENGVLVLTVDYAVDIRRDGDRFHRPRSVEEDLALFQAIMATLRR